MTLVLEGKGFKPLWEKKSSGRHDGLLPNDGVSLRGRLVTMATTGAPVLMALLFAFFGLIIVAIKAGDTFVRHDYYILPFVPFMAIAAAFALQKIPVRRWRIAALALVMLEGLANQAHDFFPSSNQRAILRLESGCVVSECAKNNACAACATFFVFSLAMTKWRVRPVRFARAASSSSCATAAFCRSCRTKCTS